MPMATHWRVEVKNNAFYCTFLQIPEILVDRRNPRQGSALADVRFQEGTAMVLGPPRRGLAASRGSTPLISTTVSFLRC